MNRKKRTYNSNLIKETLSYSTNDIEALYNVHKRTVQEWYKAGLPRIDERKPFLVLGADLKEFIKHRLNGRKRKCRENEFYCLKCKKPRTSLENKVQVRALSATRRMIVGICCQCRTKVNKIFSVENLPKVSQIFVVQQPHNKDIIGSDVLSLNTDIIEEVNQP